MTPKFRESIRCTQAFWHIDGLVELGTGIIFLLLGIILIPESITPSESTLSTILSFSQNAILIGGTIGIGLLTGLILNWQARELTFVDGKSSLLVSPGIFFMIKGSYLLISGDFTLRRYLKPTHSLNGEAA